MDNANKKKPPLWKRGPVCDAAIALVLFLAAYAWAVYYLDTWPGTPSFYQKKCAPAVMIGLGYNYCEPAAPMPEAITEFLALETDRLDVAALPENIELAPSEQTLGFHLYAYYAMGLLWRVTGVSWPALHHLMALLFALSIGCAWYILRLGAGRPVALAGAVLMMFSPGYLYILPHLRDFSKTPFVLAVIALLGYAVVRERRLRGLLVICGALGLAMGVGLGFRQDLLVCLPVTVAGLLCFLPGGLRRTWKRRLLSVGMLLVCFLTSAYPVFQAIPSRTPNSFHAIMLGLTTPFNQNLGLGGTPYEIGYYYRDEYAHTLLASYAHAKLDRDTQLAYNTPEYNAVGRRFFLDQFLAHFPADFTARWYASIKRTLDYVAFAIDSNLPANLGDGRLEALAWFRWRVFGFLAGAGLWIAVLALMVVSLRSVRLALFGTLVFFYFCGYPTLQYMQRHYFYLEVLFWWALAVLVWQTGRGLWWLRKPEHRTRTWRALRTPAGLKSAAVRRAALFAGILVLGAGGVLWAARMYQSFQVRGIYTAYAAVEGEELAADVTKQQGAAVFRPKGFLDHDAFSPAEAALQVQTGLLVVECLPAERPIPLTFVYEAANKMNDFSRMVNVPSRSEAGEMPVRVFFPVYNAPPSYSLKSRYFDSIRVPEALAHRVRGLYAVRAYASLPVLLNLTLPAEHATLSTYLAWEGAAEPAMLRAFRSYGRNQLANGDFERWADDVEAPLGSMPPKLSRIQRETGAVARGASAVRQTWNAEDQLAGLPQRFYVVADNLTGGAAYELFLEAKVLPKRDFAISAWQVIERAEGPPQVALLNPVVCHVSGKLDNGFRAYHGLFRVAKTDRRFSVVLATSGTGNTQPGDTVIWDNWRLLRRHID